MILGTFSTFNNSDRERGEISWIKVESALKKISGRISVQKNQIIIMEVHSEFQTSKFSGSVLQVSVVDGWVDGSGGVIRLTRA